MKIESYNLNLQGSSNQKSYQSVKEDLKVWFNEQRNEDLTIQSPQDDDTLITGALKPQEAKGDDIFELSDKDKLKIQLLEEFVQMLTGKPVKFLMPKSLRKSAGYDEKGQRIPQQNKTHPSGGRGSGFGLIYNRSEEKAVRTTVDFKAQGVVKTSDGREINFQSTFHVDQALIESSQTQIRIGDALKDPLVINFDNPVPVFGDSTFEFDLLADGSNDTLYNFSSDSAYLSIDKNSNGKIDNGLELFGPQTNNGFEELKQFDTDQNGWIDENDEIFNQLKLWSKDENGQDVLLGLIDRNVGAIYLGHVATSLDLYSSVNQIGKLRDSGVVLSENGKTYSIQEIDVRV
ncbi:MAG: hypothetical protein JXQ23_12950 [Clostridia bacterium]|nr:hypothetical protein [Clostridia bacterium]